MTDSENEWPSGPYERYQTFHTDFVTAPEIIRNDRQFFDHKHGYSGGRGRISLDVAFIGEDGFRHAFESLTPRPPEEVLPDAYGGIVAFEDACSDYVACSRVLLDDGPERTEDVEDAMAVARDPLIAAAAVRAWYDRQFGVDRYMVRKNDHWRAERRRQRKEREKEKGVQLQFVEVGGDTECDRCSTFIPAGGKVWTATIPPGREKEGRCTVCARAIANGAEDDEYGLRGADPREHAVDVGGADR